jgi:hypothetical protein
LANHSKVLTFLLVLEGKLDDDGWVKVGETKSMKFSNVAVEWGYEDCLDAEGYNNFLFAWKIFNCRFNNNWMKDGII